MKADLEELVISNNDLYALTEMSTLNFIAFPSFKQMALPEIEKKVKNNLANGVVILNQKSNFF